MFYLLLMIITGVTQKNGEASENYIHHNNGLKNFFENAEKELSPLRLNRPSELWMQEKSIKGKDKKTYRFVEANTKSKVDIWTSKNSFMPSLAPLPSLMKKFGDQVKEEKKRRDTYCSTQFQTPLYISNKNQSISRINYEREESSKSMLSNDNFISRRLKAERAPANVFK